MKLTGSEIAAIIMLTSFVTGMIFVLIEVFKSWGYKVKYEKDDGMCKTICPVSRGVCVGSAWCKQDCKNFKKIDPDKQIVYCKKGKK